MNEESKRGTAGIYELFMLGLCVYVLIALGTMTLFDLDPSVVLILEYADHAVCCAFLFDFALQFARAKSKLQYMKWGWLDLLSSIPTVVPLRWGRLARTVQILRLLRGVKSVKYIGEYLGTRRADSTVAGAAFVGLLTVVLSSIAVLHFEREAPTANIKSAEDALWWACVTITTAGYGDRFPVTTGGRIVATIAMTTGVGLFGTFTAFVAQWFIQPKGRKQDDQLRDMQQTLIRLEDQLRRRNM